MKNNRNLNGGLILAAIVSGILFYATSCGNNTKTEDGKEIAEEHNEAKFDNTNMEKDAQFLVNAAETYLQEIRLGQLAQQSSVNPDVKELGKMMEESHQKLLNDLSDLARNKLVSLPASAGEDAIETYNKLTRKSGSDFDKAFCEMVVNDHKEAISAFEKEILESKDIDIKALVEGQLSELRRHLDYALSCQKKCEGK